jgi:hypothetical protein
MEGSGMKTNQSHFNRILLIILLGLYLLSIAFFIYANWAADPAAMEWWMTLLNIPILSIPLVLLYGSLYVLVVAWRQHAAGEPVSPRLAKLIHWGPRVAAILIILFISLFSLDVFEMEASPLELLGGFLIHNIPSILMLILLIFAWKRPAVGFVAFVVVAALMTILFVRQVESLPNMLLFSFPILLIGLLFYADWKWLKPGAGQIEAAT